MFSKKVFINLIAGLAILSNSRVFANEDLANLLGWQPNNTNLCKGTYVLPKYIRDHPVVNEQAPLRISAQGPEIFKQQGISELKNNVVMTQPGRLLTADKIYLFRNKQSKIYQIVLIGHVRLYQEKSVLISDDALITLHPRTVHLSKMAYHYYTDATTLKTGSKPFNAWGTASSGDETANKVMTLHDATYSTCNPTNPTWQIKAGKVVLDKPNNVGKVYNATLKLGRLPILWAPYYSFQLNNARKTGFLMPVFGNADRTGYYLGLPYYLNLAPNYDLLLTPEYYGYRGFRALANFRYMSESSHGFIKASILPNDQLFEEERIEYANQYSLPQYNRTLYQPYLNDLKTMRNLRGHIGAANFSKFSEHFYLRYYLNWVSDPYYFQDITTGTLFNENTLTNQLLNLIQTDSSNSHWDFNAYLLHYQTLHIITQIQNQSQALDQYGRLPTLNLNTYYSLLPLLDFEMYSDYANFSYDSLLPLSKPTGQRLHLRPGLSLSLQDSGGFIKPQLWLDNVAYDLDHVTPGISQTASRTLPIVDVETGLHLLNHFGNYTQTLEPRIFYLYVPHKNQNNLPNFDTLQLPFYFDQLFSLNAFDGIDRLENANQMSFSLTSNILRESDGSKIFSASLGNIHYFTQPTVCLVPGCVLSKRNASPLVGKFTFNPNHTWSINSSLAYDTYLDVTNNAAITLGYHKDGRHVANFSYRYVNVNAQSLPTFTKTTKPRISSFANTSNHLIFSFAWPISMRWSTLGYTDFDANLKRLNNIYAGVQFDSCCYALRFVVKRLFSGSKINSNGTLKNTFDTGYFVELTLKGLGSFGSGSNSLLSSIIPGYKPGEIIKPGTNY